MTKDELLACLIDRPCDACKFHTDLGCSKWSCAFEGKTEEWIPCEERLPEEEGYYKVTCQNKKPCLPQERYTADGYFNGKFDERFVKVIAWLPRVEPYEGRTE